MIRVITALYEYAGREDARVIDLPNLSVNDAQNGNWKKASYWGLIDSENPRSGSWHITARGERFLRNEEPLSPHVVMYRNRVVYYEGEPVLLKDVQYRRQKRAADYVADSQPHTLSGVA